jgi:hypothetical protein
LDFGIGFIGRTSQEGQISFSHRHGRSFWYMDAFGTNILNAGMLVFQSQGSTSGLKS